MSKVIIIGGGVLGSSIAYNLASEGVETVLFDRNDAGKATTAGAGILAPETSHHENEQWFNFAIRALEYYSGLHTTLEEELKCDIGFGTCPILEVAIDDDELSEFARIKEQIFRRQTQRGYPSINDLFELSAMEIASRFPMIAPAVGGFYY